MSHWGRFFWDILNYLLELCSLQITYAVALPNNLGHIMLNVKNFND